MVGIKSAMFGQQNGRSPTKHSSRQRIGERCTLVSMNELNRCFPAKPTQVLNATPVETRPATKMHDLNPFSSEHLPQLTDFVETGNDKFITWAKSLNNSTDQYFCAADRQAVYELTDCASPAARVETRSSGAYRVILPLRLVPAVLSLDEIKLPAPIGAELDGLDQTRPPAASGVRRQKSSWP